MGLTDLLMCIVIGLVILPWAVYACVKVGTIGFFRGREFFNKSKDEETRTNGKRT